MVKIRSVADHVQIAILHINADRNGANKDRCVIEKDIEHPKVFQRVISALLALVSIEQI